MTHGELQDTAEELRLELEAYVEEESQDQLEALEDIFEDIEKLWQALEARDDKVVVEMFEERGAHENFYENYREMRKDFSEGRVTDAEARAEYLDILLKSEVVGIVSRPGSLLQQVDEEGDGRIAEEYNGQLEEAVVRLTDMLLDAGFEVTGEFEWLVDVQRHRFMPLETALHMRALLEESDEPVELEVDTEEARKMFAEYDALWAERGRMAGNLFGGVSYGRN
ncbi:MAG: hypothetical protein H6922_01830 [Pseudomonadaceae bacterium]|nr:hypothetical protein [Pseudomonadaceae bacterium]